MLTRGMTIDEVKREIATDMQSIIKMMDYRENNYRRAVLKARVFPLYFDPFFYTSPRKNNWVVLIEVPTRKAITSDNSKITFAVFLNTEAGYYVYMPTWINGNLLVVAIQPHLFRRFRERMNLQVTGRDLIARFLKYNASFVFDTKNTEYEGQPVTEIAASTKEGVALGVAIKGGFFLKTFITYEMLKGEQIEVYTRNEQFRKEIHEEIIK